MKSAWMVAAYEPSRAATPCDAAEVGVGSGTHVGAVEPVRVRGGDGIQERGVLRIRDLEFGDLVAVRDRSKARGICWVAGKSYEYQGDGHGRGGHPRPGKRCHEHRLD